MAAAGEPEHHRRYDGMAVQHVLGGLSQDDGHLFRAHLMECEHCRARVGELRAIAHDLADVERDEERMREAKRLETKRRDDGSDSPPSEPRPRRTRNSQTVIALLLFAIAAMGIWVFFLRMNITDLESQRDAALDASRTLEAGRAWDVESSDDVDAEVREDGGSLVVVIEGLDDGDYELEVIDAEGERIDGQPARPAEGRLFALLPELDAQARGVRLVLDDVRAGSPRVGLDGDDALMEAYASN